MNTVKVKTSELEGAALDWAVAQIENDDLDVTWKPLNGEMIGFGSIGSSPAFPCIRLKVATSAPSGLMVYSPSADWEQGGPLIEKHHIQTSYNGNHFSQSPTREHWCAYACKDSGAEYRPSGSGPSPLIAAMRALVAAKLGDEVEVPAELVP